jgi:anthranilate/para-aminobenzoate synthase component I
MRSNRSYMSVALALDDSQLKFESPVDVFHRCQDRCDLAWFDSAVSEKAENTWTYFLVAPTERLEAYSDTVIRYAAGSEIPRTYPCNMFTFSRLLKKSHVTRKHVDGAPPFLGGWAGFVSYDCFQTFERESNDPLKYPWMCLNFFDAILAYSHQQRKWWAGASALYATSDEETEIVARNKIKQLLEQFAAMNSASEISELTTRLAVSNCNQQQYEDRVGRALRLIQCGEIYQINLAQRLTVPWEKSAAALYLRLRKQSRARFGAYLGSGLIAPGKSICSVSPELFLSVREGEVVTRPIKGTRPLGNDTTENSRAREELSASDKERAELNMIIDLERNDLGRVCEYDSVKVVSAGEVEELPTLFHRVAAITGRLKPGCSAARLLRATFPGGSVTGAPKIRAMQIINDLEREARGPYCGAIGWLGLDGNMELSIAIRTALCDEKSRLVHYHAGSGIVADSDPVREYEETLHKAAAFLRATNSELSAEFGKK